MDEGDPALGSWLCAPLVSASLTALGAPADGDLPGDARFPPVNLRALAAPGPCGAFKEPGMCGLTSEVWAAVAETLERDAVDAFRLCAGPPPANASDMEETAGDQGNADGAT